MSKESRDETAAQLKIMEIAALPEEEASRVIFNIERIDQALQSICGSLCALTPFMQAVIVNGAETLKKEAELTGVMCDHCAMRAECGKKSEDIRVCSEYREQVPRCVACEHWDSVICVSSNKCVRGENFEPQEV